MAKFLNTTSSGKQSTVFSPYQMLDAHNSTTPGKFWMKSSNDAAKKNLIFFSPFLWAVSKRNLDDREGSEAGWARLQKGLAQLLTFESDGGRGHPAACRDSSDRGGRRGCPLGLLDRIIPISVFST